MKDAARTAAADEVDRVARGSRPTRAPRSGRPEARESAHAPVPPASTGPDLRSEIDALANALKELQGKFGTQAQATVDQWAELEGRMRALERAAVPEVTHHEHIAVLSAQVTDLHQQVRDLHQQVRDLHQQVRDLHQQVLSQQKQVDVRPSRQKMPHPLLNLG